MIHAADATQAVAVTMTTANRMHLVPPAAFERLPTATSLRPRMQCCFGSISNTAPARRMSHVREEITRGFNVTTFRVASSRNLSWGQCLKRFANIRFACLTTWCDAQRAVSTSICTFRPKASSFFDGKTQTCRPRTSGN